MKIQSTEYPAQFSISVEHGEGGEEGRDEQRKERGRKGEAIGRGLCKLLAGAPQKVIQIKAFVGPGREPKSHIKGTKLFKNLCNIHQS